MHLKWKSKFGRLNPKPLSQNDITILSNRLSIFTGNRHNIMMQCEHVLSKDETLLPICTTNSMVSIVLNHVVKFRLSMFAKKISRILCPVMFPIYCNTCYLELKIRLSLVLWFFYPSPYRPVFFFLTDLEFSYLSVWSPVKCISGCQYCPVYWLTSSRRHRLSYISRT